MPLSSVQSYRVENVTTKKEKPPEMLTERFGELAVIRFNAERK